MAPVRGTLHLLIYYAAILKVSSCVCYVGQEPRVATDKQYSWSLAEQTPCEYTEFRLGGVNMKPQMKPHEGTIGEVLHLSINDYGQVVQKNPDCKEDQQHTEVMTSESTESVTSCSTNTNEFKTLKLREWMGSPICLTFTVKEGAEYVSVDFSTGDQERAVYEVYLGRQFAELKETSNPSAPPQAIKGNRTNYIGVPVTITYNNGHFEVAVAERAEPDLQHDVATPPPTSWFVTFRSGEQVEMIFFEPCNPDFEYLQ